MLLMRPLTAMPASLETDDAALWLLQEMAGLWMLGNATGVAKGCTMGLHLDSINVPFFRTCPDLAPA